MNVPESARKAPRFSDSIRETVLSALCAEHARFMDIEMDKAEKAKTPEDPMWSLPGDHKASLERVRKHLADIRTAINFFSPRFGG